MFGFIDRNSPDCSIVPTHAIFESEMQTNGDLDIDGKLIGNVDIGRTLRVNGILEGNINTFDLLVTEKGSVKGNINVDNILLCSGIIEGKIEGYIVEVNGVINGDIYAKEKVIVNKNAIINGDVYCKDFYIDYGGKINGNIKKHYLFTRI